MHKYYIEHQINMTLSSKQNIGKAQKHKSEKRAF